MLRCSNSTRCLAVEKREQAVLQRGRPLLVNFFWSGPADQRASSVGRPLVPPVIGQLRISPPSDLVETLPTFPETGVHRLLHPRCKEARTGPLLPRFCGSSPGTYLPRSPWCIHFERNVFSNTDLSNAEPARHAPTDVQRSASRIRRSRREAPNSFAELLYSKVATAPHSGQVARTSSKRGFISSPLHRGARVPIETCRILPAVLPN